MKFIKPSEISSKIMTLIDESDEFVLLVSPYIKISKWYKLLKKLENLHSRNIPVEFVIRDDKTNQVSFQELQNLNIPFKAIPDLHCKLYLNEKYAIVSSMNLLLSSEINSLEIAYSTENDEEYNELIDFCKRYLNHDFQYKKEKEIPFEYDWRDYVVQFLEERMGKRIDAFANPGEFVIKTGTNTYSCFIWDSTQKNILRISGILSGKEFNFLNNNPSQYPIIEEMNIEIQKGKNGYYDMIWGTANKHIISNDINNLIDDDKQRVLEKVIEFILSVDGFKQWFYENVKY